MSDCFYKNGLKFNCVMCKNCCCLDGGVVMLSDLDLERLCKGFGMDEMQFINKYCQWIENTDGYYYLCLNDKNGSECVFWQDGCGCYESRPTQCRTYPWWTKVLENRGSWNEEKSFCPGIDTGDLHSEKEIEKNLESYRNNRQQVIRVKAEEK